MWTTRRWAIWQYLYCGSSYPVHCKLLQICTYMHICSQIIKLVTSVIPHVFFINLRLHGGNIRGCTFVQWCTRLLLKRRKLSFYDPDAKTYRTSSRPGSLRHTCTSKCTLVLATSWRDCTLLTVQHLYILYKLVWVHYYVCTRNILRET